MAGHLQSAAENNLNISLGCRIRSFRKDRGMKIIDVAELTGLTSSTISQIERALMSPSIASLKKICDALEIPIGCLFENDAQITNAHEGTSIDSAFNRGAIRSPALEIALSEFTKAFPVVHKKNRKILSPSEGVRFYLLTPDMSGPIELIYNEYDPGAGTGTSLYSHPGSECGLILSGELLVSIEGKEYILCEGDSITFDSSKAHMKKNISDQLCTCIWANCPPWF